jgi:DNA replication protein DnaC
MFASRFGSLAEQAIRERKGYIGYLEALLLAEIEERERNTIERCIREAHLPRVKTFEESAAGYNPAPRTKLTQY